MFSLKANAIKIYLSYNLKNLLIHEPFLVLRQHVVLKYLQFHSYLNEPFDILNRSINNVKTNCVSAQNTFLRNLFSKVLLKILGRTKPERNVPATELITLNRFVMLNHPTKKREKIKKYSSHQKHRSQRGLVLKKVWF